MKLSPTEANRAASQLLSDAERERERRAQRRTAWLVILFPALKFVRPTQRVAAFRSARLRAARDPWILVPSLAGLLLYMLISIGVPKHRPAWVGLLPGTIAVGYYVAQYVRTRALLRKLRV